MQMHTITTLKSVFAFSVEIIRSLDVFDFLPVWKLTYRLLLGIFLFVGISIAIFLLTLDYFFRRVFFSLNTHWFSCESNLLPQHIVALEFSSLIWEFKKKRYGGVDLFIHLLDFFWRLKQFSTISVYVSGKFQCCHQIPLKIVFYHAFYWIQKCLGNRL